MPMKPKEMLRYLKKNGFSEVKGGGKGGHQKMYNSKTNRTTEVPMHAKELTKAMENEILKQAGLR